MAAKLQGVDKTVISKFVATRACRRIIISEYLDSRKVECSRNLARCNRCREGVIAVFRAHL